MSRYVVLLKGINVGRAKRIAMADLRVLLAGLGYTEVQTLLQSGNAVFGASRTTPERISARVSGAVDQAFSMQVSCLVRTAGEIHAAVGAHPLESVATDGSKLLANFLSAVPDPTLLKRHDPTSLDAAHIVVGDRVIYQWCPDGVLAAPPVGAFAEKHLGVTVTARNWNTLTKLNTLLHD